LDHNCIQSCQWNGRSCVRGRRGDSERAASIRPGPADLDMALGRVSARQPLARCLSFGQRHILSRLGVVSSFGVERHAAVRREERQLALVEQAPHVLLGAGVPAARDVGLGWAACLLHSVRRPTRPSFRRCAVLRVTGQSRVTRFTHTLVPTPADARGCRGRMSIARLV
jgi:hypothetical protein